jgi:hypothetical protein
MTGWTDTNGHSSISTEQSLTATKSVKFIFANNAGYVAQAVAATNGHIIYMRASAYVVAGYVGPASLMGRDYGNAATSVDAQFDIAVTGQWQHKSLLYTAEDGGYTVRVGCVNAATGTVYFDNVLAIDLTEFFGAGNEPTAAEMDAMLLAYAPTTAWFDDSAVLDVSANPAPLQVDATLNPWFTTLKTGVTKPEFWFGFNDMIYKYSNTFPTSGAPHMTYFTPSHDYGTAVRKKRVTTMKLTGSGGTVSVTPVQDGVEKTAKNIELPATRPSPFSVNGYVLGFKLENAGGDPIVIRDKEETYL